MIQEQEQTEPEKAEKAATYGEGESEATYAEPQAAETQGQDKLRKEAAKYRRRLRETEAERDQLAARNSDLERAEVERQITGPGGLASASDLWTAGVQLADLRGEDGGLDPEKVKEARDKVLSEHPHWREPTKTSMDGGVRGMVPEGPPSFGGAIKQAAGLE